MKKLKGSIRISRPSCSGGQEIMCISIRDNLSANEFLDIEMSYRDFVIALTAESGDMEFEARGVENIGKKHEHKNLKIPFEYKGDWKLRSQAAYEEGLKHCPEGWVLDTYFGSQNSFGDKVANGTIRRWVEVSGEDE